MSLDSEKTNFDSIWGLEENRRLRRHPRFEEHSPKNPKSQDPEMMKGLDSIWGPEENKRLEEERRMRNGKTAISGQWKKSPKQERKNQRMQEMEEPP